MVVEHKLPMDMRSLSGPDRPPSRKEAPRKLGRRERRRAEIQERLYRAAVKLFMRRGLHATTVKDITEAADVGKGTFFNYFSTKEHVLAMFYDRGRRAIDDTLRAVREGEAVRQAYKEWARRRSEERTPALVRSFLLAICSNEAVRAMVMPHLQLSRRGYEELIAIGQQRGEIRTDQPAAELARAVQELNFGASLFWSIRQDVPYHEILEANFDLICSPVAGATTTAARKRRAGDSPTLPPSTIGRVIPNRP